MTKNDDVEDLFAAGMPSSDVPHRLTPDDLTNNLVAGLRSAKSLYRTSAHCTFSTNELPAVRGVVDLAGGNPSRSRGGRRGTEASFTGIPLPASVIRANWAQFTGSSISAASLRIAAANSAVALLYALDDKPR